MLFARLFIANNNKNLSKFNNCVRRKIADKAENSGLEGKPNMKHKHLGLGCASDGCLDEKAHVYNNKN